MLFFIKLNVESFGLYFLNGYRRVSERNINGFFWEKILV